ncbi:MAG TPA: glycosyltransferase family 39 protein, partial [Bryobacteraceae bacterium]|nr:glycosyltransferase family 39 protein [Bryobacteraceae bacterium]
MFQAAAALVGAGSTVAACYAAGSLLIDRLNAPLTRAERFPLAFVLGGACLHLAVFAILALHIAYWPVVVALLAGAIGAAVWKGSWKIRGKELEPLSHNLKILCAILFGAFTVLYFFHAWAPESSPDGSSYHLGLVARYLRAHGFERITTDMLASLSGGMEMLFFPAFAIGRHSAAALVHFAFTAALAMSIFAYGRRLGRPWVGAAAALFVYASPVVGIDGTSAYNDVAVAAVAFAVFYWLELWDSAGNELLLIPAGLLCGYAYAIKYTAFVMLPFALAFVAWRSRRWRALVPVAACAALMIAPWMLKDWVEVRNPAAPFGNKIFRNPYEHVAVEQELSTRMRRYGLQNKWTLPLEVTIGGQTTIGITGPLFLLAPLALLALKFRAGRRLLAAGALLLAVYFTNIGTRFLIPCLPFFALAMALPLRASPPLLAALMIFHAVSSWPAVMKLYAPSIWSLDRIEYKQALRMIPQDSYLRQNYPPYGIARMIDSYVPKGERVLAISRLPEAYTSREVLVSWRSALAQDLTDAIRVGWVEDFQPRVLQTFTFPEKTVRRMRVRQTTAAKPDEQWSVAEMRFYDRGGELPRRPEWRLRAWPNPWEVQFAFDNSEATRWRTWEHPAPLGYLDVDFGKPQAVDEIRMETS